MANVVFSNTDKDTKNAVECKIKGQIPNWLNGSLYRNGSAKFDFGKQSTPHLFDGCAMIHKYSFSDGQVTYMNRFLDSEYRKKHESAQRLVVGGFGHRSYPDPCKSLFNRYFSYYAGDDTEYDNDNVCVVLTGDQLYSITESKGMSLLDKNTLEKQGRFEDASCVSMHRHTAHAHTGKDGTIYNLGTLYAGHCKQAIIKIPPKSPGSTTLLDKAELAGSVVSRWPRDPSYMHSFGISPSCFIIIQQPVSTNVLALAAMKYTGTTFLENIKFHANEKTHITLINRKTGEPKSTVYVAPPLFTFHHINAFEENGFLTIDICAYEDTTLLNALLLENLRKGDPLPKGDVWRFKLPLAVSGTTQVGINLLPENDGGLRAFVEKDSGRNPVVMCVPRKYGIYLELPRINYAFNELPYRYTYGCTVFFGEIALLKKVDLETGAVLTWGDPDYLTGCEPVFVPEPGATEEDQGVVLASILSHREDRPSFLVVLCARTFRELARAEIPFGVKVPFSFHGEFDAQSTRNTEQQSHI